MLSAGSIVIEQIGVYQNYISIAVQELEYISHG